MNGEAMRLFIIGFSCVGKTTLSKAISKYYRLPWIDTDQAIEKKTGMSISDIFKLQGEKYFRMLEEELVKEIIRERFQGVISTGGGVVEIEEVRELLKHEQTLFFTIEKKTLFNRMKNAKNRPIIQQGDWEKKYQYRLKLYRETTNHMVALSGKKREDLAKISEWIEKSDILNNDSM